MELNFNPNVSAATRATPLTKATPAVKAQSSTPEFAGAAALERALSRTPEVRPDAVQRARALVADGHYPSAEALGRLARVLAGQWTPTASKGAA